VSTTVYIEDVLGANNGVLPTDPTKPGIAGDSTNGTNAAAVLTYAAAGAGVSHVLGGIFWSYNATPTGGRLTVADGGTTIFDIDITVSGPGYFPFSRAIKGTANSALTITLAAGGAAVAGKINARHWTE
jgi:hypothetical protein